MITICQDSDETYFSAERHNITVWQREWEETFPHYQKFQQFPVPSYLEMAPISTVKPNYFAKTGKAFFFWIGCLHTHGFVDMLCPCRALMGPYR